VSRPRIACAPGGAHLAAGGSRPITSCSAAAQRIKELEAALAPEISRGRQETLTQAQLDSTTQQDLEGAYSAVVGAIDQEAARVFNQEPTDEGDAELQVLTSMAMGIERLSAFLELPGSATAFIRGELGDVMQYRLKNIQRACRGPQTAAQLLAHAVQAFAVLEFEGRGDVGNLQPDPAALYSACLVRVRANLDVSDDSSIQGGSSFDGQHAKVSADGIMIVGTAGQGSVPPGLHADDASLSYDSATITLTPPLDQFASAKYTDKSGYFRANIVSFSAAALGISRVQLPPDRHDLGSTR
jgi:hypothetical protein